MSGLTDTGKALLHSAKMMLLDAQDEAAAITMAAEQAAALLADEHATMALGTLVPLQRNREALLKALDAADVLIRRARDMGGAA